jgi:hypoxanthine-guanine phosphoribosyltransferase
MNSKEFSLIIEDIVKKHKELSYVDAIVKYCEENNIEIETTARLITKQLNQKIQHQSAQLNLLKGGKPGVD